MKKKIGISFSKTNFSHYWEWFTSEDLKEEFELVELSFQKNNTADIHDCHGFVLTGGIDIEPTLYGGEWEYYHAPDEFQNERDRFEEKIFRHAQSAKVPLLGICRGLQLVNVLQGGKLIQDLGHANEIHRKSAEDKHHGVRVETNTLLHEIVGTESGHVNSAHHQAVDIQELGQNLRVNAFAMTEDAAVEGIEFSDKQGRGFMLCVQWHPERMKDKEENPFSKKLKKRFLEEIKKQS
jgi:putative glutamine amidotransferase